MSIWQALGFSAPNTNVVGQQALAGELYDQRQKFQEGLDNYQNRTAPQMGSVGMGPTAQTSAPSAILQQRAEFNSNPMFATPAAATAVRPTVVSGPSTFQAANAGAPMLAQNGAATAGAVAQPTLATGGTANAATVDTTGGFRPQQGAAIDTIQAAANGTAPSAAQEQLKQATARNIATQMALRSTARGGGVGLAERAAADNTANINQTAAGQSSELAANEQAQARAQLGGALQGARGQDIQAQGINAANQTDVSKFNTGLGADLSKFNVGTATDVGKFNTGLAADTSKFNTGLQSQTSQFNAGTVNQSAEAQAAREQAARASNAAAQNTTNAQQAGITAGEAGQGAALGTDVSKFNAGLETDLQKFQRQSLDQNQQFNATQGNDMSKYLAGLTATVGQSNTAQANDMTKFGAGLGVQQGIANLGAQVDFAKMDDATKQAYLQYLLGTQGQSVGVNEDINNTMLGAAKAQSSALGGTLGAITGGAASIATGGAKK